MVEPAHGAVWIVAGEQHLTALTSTNLYGFVAAMVLCMD
jgi:hypothetical protein